LTEGFRTLPLVPLLPGFALNTMIFGLAWFAAGTGFVGLKRSRRTRRGLCPACAYDLSGDPASGCPECGWNRPELDPR